MQASQSCEAVKEGQALKPGQTKTVNPGQHFTSLGLLLPALPAQQGVSGLASMVPELARPISNQTGPQFKLRTLAAPGCDPTLAPTFQQRYKTSDICPEPLTHSPQHPNLTSTKTYALVGVQPQPAAQCPSDTSGPSMPASPNPRL